MQDCQSQRACEETAEGNLDRHTTVRGVLTFGSFFKLAVVSVVGASLLGMLLLSLTELVIRLPAPPVDRDLGTSVPDRLRVLGVAFTLINIIGSALLTGVLGYPVYRLITRLSGGMSYRFIGPGPGSLAWWATFRPHFVCAARVLLPLGLAGSLIFAAVSLSGRPPLYHAMSTLLMSRETPHSDNESLLDTIETQTRILLSRHLAQETIKHLGESKQDVLSRLHKVAVRPVGRSSVVVVEVVSTDPQLSARYVNSLVTSYLNFSDAADSNHLLSVKILETAVVPSMPMSSRKVSTVFRAGLLGLAIGIFLSGSYAAFRVWKPATALYRGNT